MAVFAGAAGETRTLTGVTPLGPKPSASANSATAAPIYSINFAKSLPEYYSTSYLGGRSS